MSRRWNIFSKFPTRTPLGDDNTPSHADGTEFQLAVERESALDLLYAMFGEANDDLGGAESVDLDVEMPSADIGIPHAASGIHRL